LRLKTYLLHRKKRKGEKKHIKEKNAFSDGRKWQRAQQSLGEDVAGPAFHILYKAGRTLGLGYLEVSYNQFRLS
jgi:hypothetical protein